jgi:hypothetical protein
MKNLLMALGIVCSVNCFAECRKIDSISNGVRPDTITVSFKDSGKEVLVVTDTTKGGRYNNGAALFIVQSAFLTGHEICGTFKPFASDSPYLTLENAKVSANP